MNEPNTADWIMAFSGTFAAIGTVGAVVFALWQVGRQRKRHLVVECRHAVVVATEGSVNILSLRATNDGFRPVTVTMAYLMTDDGRQVISPPSLYSNSLPKTLQDGESVDFSWLQSNLDRLRAEEGGRYLYAFFTDVLGNVYSAPFPGVTVKRKGLRRRTVYVAGDE